MKLRTKAPRMKISQNVFVHDFINSKSWQGSHLVFNLFKIGFSEEFNRMENHD